MIAISVVVPFYNSEKYIIRCIDGLLNQEYPADGYELIFIDNNSTDSSADIVKRYPRIKLITQDKRGSYAARNRGINEAAGEIIAFTDSDCVPSAGWLKEIDNVMSDPGIGIIVGGYQLGRSSYFLSLLEDYENAKNEFIFRSGKKELYYAYTRNMAVRKRLFDEIGPFLEKPRGSDVIFLRRCIDRYSCNLVCYSPGINVRHMEIDRPNKYFRKTFIYGGSMEKYAKVVDVRALSMKERVFILADTVRRKKYSPVKAISIAGILSFSYLCWVLGRLGTIIGSRTSKG